MLGLFLDENKELSLKSNIPEPTPDVGEVKIKTLLAGVCNTDLELTRGYMPFTGILGHEAVGIVTEAPDNNTLVGRRVVPEINFACGSCVDCTNGKSNHCSRRSVLGIVNQNGVMAEFFTAPANCLHFVSDDITSEAAVFTEPLAAAFRILEQVKFSPQTEVLVMGDGKLGILCALAIASTNAPVTLAGHRKDRINLAQSFGINAIHSDELPPQNLFNVVVDATGSARGFNEAVQKVRPLGTLVLKSTVAGDTNAMLSLAVVNEIKIIGSRCGPFKDALNFLQNANIDITKLVTHKFSIQNARGAFDTALDNKKALKVLIDFR